MNWSRSDLRQSDLVHGFRPAFYKGSKNAKATKALGDLFTLSDAMSNRSEGDLRPLLLLEDILKGTGEFAFASQPPNRVAAGRFRVFRRGQILYARMRPALNKCAFIGELFEGGHCSPEFFVLDPSPKYDPLFLTALLLSPKVNEALSNFVSGSSRPRLQWEHFAITQVELPTAAMQKNVGAAFSSFLRNRAELHRKYGRERQVFESVIGSL